MSSLDAAFTCAFICGLHGSIKSPRARTGHHTRTFHALPSPHLSRRWIERLLPNMLDSEGTRYLFSEYFVEAPALFFAHGLYYAVFAPCCCYCYQGSGAIVHTALHPLGPWTTLGDVACIPTPSPAAPQLLPAGGQRAAFLAAIGVPPADGVGAAPTPGQGCQYVNASTTSALRSQQSDIFQVDLAGGGKAWIWAGDRWQQSPDGLKAHDPQLWAPLVFNADKSLAPLRWVDNFTLAIV